MKYDLLPLHAPALDMHFYQLYGLNVQSAIYIPDLLEISLTKRIAEQPIALQIDLTDALVYLRDIGVFIIQGGSKIVLVATQNAKQESICQALVGVVLAVLLYQRGRYILHASAVAIEDIAIAFLGDSGAGKSSALAATIDQDFIGITDDLTAIHNIADNALVYPGVPKMKLSAAVATKLKLTQPTTPTAEESSFVLSTAHPSDAYCLRNLYILEYGPNWSIEPIPPQQVIIELMRFAGLKSVLPVRDRYYFEQVAQLARSVNLYRLKRPQDLNQLSKLPKILKDHIRSTHSGKNSLKYEVVK